MGISSAFCLLSLLKASLNDRVGRPEFIAQKAAVSLLKLFKLKDVNSTATDFNSQPTGTAADKSHQITGQALIGGWAQVLPLQVSLEILMLGNLLEKSLFLAAIDKATLRATAL